MLILPALMREESTTVIEIGTSDRVCERFCAVPVISYNPACDWAARLPCVIVNMETAAIAKPKLVGLKV